jgi:hypothetical protein
MPRNWNNPAIWPDEFTKLESDWTICCRKPGKLCRLGFRKKNTTELNAWLKSELALLHSVLPVKHRFMLISETFDQAVWANHSPRELAEALEEKLFQLSSCEGMQQITLTVMPGKLLLGCQNELLALWSSETGLCNQPEPQPGTKGYQEKVKRHG